MRNIATSIIGNGVISLLWQLRCHCNPDHNKFSSLPNTTVVVMFPNVCFWRRSLIYAQTWQVSSHFYMPVRPTLLHRMALVSFRLFCEKLGNLRDFFGQMVCCSPPPRQKIVRTPMGIDSLRVSKSPIWYDFRKQCRDRLSKYHKRNRSEWRNKEKDICILVVRVTIKVYKR